MSRSKADHGLDGRFGQREYFGRVRANKKRRTDEHYLTSFAPTCLRMERDRVPLWRGNHVAVKELVDGFARCLYGHGSETPVCSSTRSAMA
ncbi:MAG: hypothetical protein AW12_02467 [Candidatus Accumulibacter sp. BA-94]|uniref:hypothetical protein n=1 Tax=Accumulibacter sp. TaxID=2053492 RepID=UPI00045279A3|nr:hypothetical protein [Accumulibacter sp.]EXI84250.1 MAG: hypothetical protein AW12_02467 [Candidatus Accumulibacter sp. BA-94]HRD90662.1 hypothetical protein [Accumulibacter sp.]